MAPDCLDWRVGGSLEIDVGPRLAAEDQIHAMIVQRRKLQQELLAWFLVFSCLLHGLGRRRRALRLVRDRGSSRRCLPNTQPEPDAGFFLRPWSTESPPGELPLLSRCLKREQDKRGHIVDLESFMRTLLLPAFGKVLRRLSLLISHLRVSKGLDAGTLES